VSSSATSSPWLRRLHRLVRGRWPPVVLMVALCCADLAAGAGGAAEALVLAPGLVVFALLVVRGRHFPALCGAAAAAVLVLSSVVLRLAGAEPDVPLLGPILSAEDVGGVLLVLYAHRRLPPAKAVPVTGLLAVAFLVALSLRPWPSGGDPAQVVAFCVLQFLLAVGTGTYVRGWQVKVAPTPLLGLLRRQWPMMAGLSVLLFAEFANRGTGFGDLALLLGSLVLAALAVIGPLRPVEAALLGACALVCTGVGNRLIGVGSDELGPLSLTAVAAVMLLISYAVRHAAVRRAGWAVAALVVGSLVAVLLSGGVRPGEWTATAALGALLLALSIGAGLYFRARDGERRRVVRTAVEQAQQAERLALARELHDIVAHHVTGIVVQAQAAQLVAAQKPEVAAEALERIAGSGTEAMVAMRRLVASMRGAEPAGAAPAEQASTDLRADLAELAERTGPHVDLQLELDREVPQEVSRSALRLVQEALTNTDKHGSDVTSVRILVRAPHEHLHVKITDNGSGRSTAPVGGSGGYGLVGMRERIELLGGRFSAGPGERSGWRVEAWLPLAEREAG